MPRSATDWRASTIEVEAWRDYDPDARLVAGMALGSRTLERDWRPCAERLYAEGVRCVRFAQPVDLCADAPAAAARTLVLIRELTGRGVAVEWQARCGDGCASARRYVHLYPPAAVLGAPEEVAETWRDTYYPCKCVYRRGPGFLEVRDRRHGTLEMFTIDDPRHLAAIDAMVEGTPAGAVPAEVRDELAGAGLVAEQAGHLWWLPVRVYRWPFPPLVV